MSASATDALTQALDELYYCRALATALVDQTDAAQQAGEHRASLDRIGSANRLAMMLDERIDKLVTFVDMASTSTPGAE